MALLQISEPGQSPSPHQFKRSAGIDLGTTNSLIASVNKGMPATIIPDEKGNDILPSVVHYSNNEVLVGKSAENLAVVDPQNTLTSFKRWMGRSTSDIDQGFGYHFSDKATETLAKVKTCAGEITAVQASSEILKKLASRAESKLGGKLEGVVITVPAYFDDSQRQATKDAAQLAGLNVLRLLNEPTAAAIAYGLDKADDRYIAVYDLGGGTFDVSILQLSEGVFEVIATGGNTELGGDDFDQVIIDWLLEEAKLDFKQLSDSSKRELKLLARNVKHILSENEKTQIDFQVNMMDFSLAINRSTFEEKALPLVEKTLLTCREILKDAGLQAIEISDVVLVGGTTRIPLVRKSVEALYNTELKSDVDPDKVVAIGAAIQADILVGNQQKNDLLLLDVLPLSLGIETMGGLIEKIIPRNSSIPIVKAQEFTTYKDGQTAMVIHVLQGEREHVNDCRSLARFELRDIPPMVAGAARIQVTFNVDADGLLNVEAKEQITGAKAAIDVKPTYGLSDDEITDMIKASYQNAESDRDKRMLIEKQIEAKGLIESIEAALAKDADLLDQSEQEVLLEKITHLSRFAEGNDLEKIRAAITDVSKVTARFAQLRMDKSIKEALAGKNMNEVIDE